MCEKQDIVQRRARDLERYHRRTAERNDAVHTGLSHGATGARRVYLGVEYGHIQELGVQTQLRTVERAAPKSAAVRQEQRAIDAYRIHACQNPLEDVHLLVVWHEPSLRDDAPYILARRWVGYDADCTHDGYAPVLATGVPG